MSPLFAQGLFNLYIAIVFLLLALKFWTTFRRTHDYISKNFAFSFFTASIEYLLWFIPLFFFPQDFVLVKWFEIFANIAFFLTLTFLWILLPYLFPRFPVVLALGFLLISGIISVVISFFPFTPAFINKGGFMDYAFSTFQVILPSILLMATIIPIGVMFVYRTLKKGLFSQGVLFGIGLIIWIIFQPLTYQVNTFDSYVFFAVSAGFGSILVLTSLFLKLPSFAKDKKPSP